MIEVIFRALSVMSGAYFTRIGLYDIRKAKDIKESFWGIGLFIFGLLTLICAFSSIWLD